jgi:hypothetical protein
MKIRIQGDSLRIRTLRTEVARLLAGECLEETIHFAPESSAKFTYALKQDSSVSVLTVQHSMNRVAILIPVDQANAWGVTDQVGIEGDISLGDNWSLSLLVEKDFACLDRNGEEHQDTFPNPSAGTAQAGHSSPCNSPSENFTPSNT